MNKEEQFLVVQSLLEISRDTLLAALELLHDAPDLTHAVLALEDYSRSVVWLATRLAPPRENAAMLDIVRSQQARIVGVRMILERKGETNDSQG